MLVSVGSACHSWRLLSVPPSGAILHCHGLLLFSGGYPGQRHSALIWGKTSALRSPIFFQQLLWKRGAVLASSLSAQEQSLGSLRGRLQLYL